MADSKNKHGAIAYVASQVAHSNTASYDALEAAMRFDTEAIYFLSDGAPAGGKITGPVDIIAAVTAANKVRRITWHFGDGTDTSYYTYSNWINTPQHSYTSPGNYTISMVIQQMGALPCGSDSVWHTLHVKAKSSAFPTVYANECAPDTFPGNIIMLNVDSLAWNVAPPNTVSNYLIPNPTFIVPNAGVTYIGAYLYGCWVDTNNVFISNTYYWDTVLTFRPKPDLTFIAPTPDFCDSVHYVFQNYFSLNPAPTDSGYLFTILHNGTNIFSDTSANPANYFTDTAGTYIVSALAWNDCDTLLFVDTFLITAPTVVAVSNDTSLCRWDASIGLVGNPGAGTWSLNGIVVSNTFNP